MVYSNNQRSDNDALIVVDFVWKGVDFSKEVTAMGVADGRCQKQFITSTLLDTASADRQDTTRASRPPRQPDRIRRI
jgi:hypothetical protein